MVAGLVAVGVLADQRLLAEMLVRVRQGKAEEAVQPRLQRLRPAQAMPPALHVVQGRRGGELPGIALGVVAGVVHRRGGHQRVEGRAPAALAVLAAQRAGLVVEERQPAARARAEALGQRLLPQAIRHRRHGRVAVAPLGGLADRLALLDVEGQVAVTLERAPAALRPLGGVGPLARAGLDHRGQRRVLVDGAASAEALDERVGDHRQRRVADHRVGLAAPAGPQRQPSHLPVVGEHRVDEAGHALGHDQREQRVRGTEGVPQAERRVVDAAGCGHHLAARAAHAAVGVGDVARVLQRAVQRRVEEALRARIAGDADAAEQRVPLRIRRGAKFVEAAAGGGGEVALRARFVDGGQRDARLEHLPCAEVEVEHDARRLLAWACRQGLPAQHRLAETDHERELALDPVAAPDRALQAVVARRHLGGQCGRPVDEVQAVLQVDQHLHPAWAVEAVAMQRHLGRGRELHAHAVAGQPHGVPAGARALFRLDRAEVARGGVPVAAAARLQQHVAQLRNAGAAVVRVREAEDARVAELVARAVAPAAFGVVGRWEHHAEGHGGARGHVAGAVGADEGVDVAREGRRSGGAVRRRGARGTRRVRSTGGAGGTHPARGQQPAASGKHRQAPAPHQAPSRKPSTSGRRSRQARSLCPVPA